MKKKIAIKKRRFSKYLIEIVFFLLIIFLPSNLFLTLSEKNAYLSGLRVDYLIPKLYASQLLIFGLIVIWIICLIQENQKISFNSIKKLICSNKLLITALIFLLIRQFFTTQPENSLWFVFQICTSVLLFIFLYYHQWLFEKISFGWSVFVSLMIQATLGIFQFLLQKPLLPYYFFGEPRFEPYLTISKHLFSGTEKILAYGSTAHPNVLAGTTVIFCLILLKISLQQKAKKYFIRWVISLLATGSILYTTQSLSALLVLILGVGLIFAIKTKNTTKILKSSQVSKWLFLSLMFIMIIIPIFVSKQANQLPLELSLVRRKQLNQTALNISQNNVLWGVGFNQFTVHLEKYASSSETVRFVQPAHHVGLLFLAETGILGGMIIYLISKKLSRKQLKVVLFGLLLLSPIMTLDHYLYTLLSGQLLVILVLFFSRRLSD